MLTPRDRGYPTWLSAGPYAHSAMACSPIYPSASPTGRILTGTIPHPLSAACAVSILSETVSPPICIPYHLTLRLRLLEAYRTDRANALAITTLCASSHRKQADSRAGIGIHACPKTIGRLLPRPPARLPVPSLGRQPLSATCVATLKSPSLSLLRTATRATAYTPNM